MIRKKKNYLSYYVWFKRVEDAKRNTVAHISGRTIKSSDDRFLSYMKSGMSGPAYPVKFHKHSYNVIDERTDTLVAKVDDRLNVFNTKGIYSGSMHNVTRLLSYTLTTSLAVIIAFLIFIILLLRTTVDSVKPKDIYISDTDGITLNEQWDIFGKTENDKIVMPGKKGVYYFSIHNTNYFDIVVTISFEDDNDHNIPMKYRLRKNALTYLKGDSKTYLDAEDMTTKEIVIPARSHVTLALDWYWDENIDDNVDTNAGLSGDGIYTVYVNIFAEEKTK